MANLSLPPRIAGLHRLAPHYEAVICDVWGVLHNGVTSFAKARTALANYRAAGGTVVLITNAPRTSHPVAEQLAALGIEKASYDAIVTSGDVTRSLLATYAPARLHHIGLERDASLYEGLALERSDIADAEIVSCTNLRDDSRESPADYEEELRALVARDLPFICANPDIVVERGHQLVFCAGALAARYAALGGRVVVAGKPHAPIYEAALAKLAALRGHAVERASVLAIGDGAPTDLKGACDQGIDVLFVTGGIHAGHFGPPLDPDTDAVHRFLQAERLGAAAFIAELSW